jgi:undecaprenyl-diphosphatase
MDLELLLEALLLGVVEGLTEFVPVSSTGHLILLIDLIGFRGPPGKVFEVVIQLGAIFAVCWAYRHRFLGVATGLCATRTRLASPATSCSASSRRW